MGVVIDSNILIRLESQPDALDAVFSGSQDQEFFLSVISISELLHGVERAKNPKTKSRRSAFVEGVIDTFPIYPVTTPIARAHARLWAELTKKGQMIGMNDSWIAATCLACNCTLATTDIKDFNRVPGLNVLDCSEF